MKLSLKVMAAAAMMALPAAAGAQTYTLYVGYPDGLRTGGFFPFPWDGDPGVQFFSGYAGPSPDAGAIMFQNTGAVTLFIQALVYTLTSPGNIYGSYSYDFASRLGGGVALDPGKFAIFTGLDNVGDFDTSDFAVGPCGSPNPNAPHLATTVSGSSAGFDDTGLILTTGGVDEASCNNFGHGGNESLGWRPVGTTGVDVPGNQVAPEPATLVLTGSGLLVVAGIVRRRRAAA